jgi:hypothetical protein
MANSLDTAKSALGRLLASEDIRVEHKQVAGPSFDVKARVLTLPIWKNVDSDLYDLMIGHEVGHALFTPTDGWLDEVKAKGKGFKQMLNLVEDARIEKKMKRKYPGLARPMYNGYTQLVDRNFFGAKLNEMVSFSFPDRLNVYFKLGVRSGVSFSVEEQNIVDRIEAAESFSDVLTIANELHAVASSEAQDLEDFFDSLPDNFQPSEGSGEEGEGESMSQQEFQDAIQKLRDKGRNELADRLEKASEQVLTKLQEQDSNDVSSSTQEALDTSMDKLIDANAYPNEYVTMPDLDPSKYVIPSSVTYHMMEFDHSVAVQKETIYSDFMRTTKRYVNYLVREFELRRNASQLAKAKSHKTGKLNVDQIWKYRLSEDLFLTNTVVPNGKNHGMLMVVDLSSSMAENIPGTIEQLISLVLFCRKVNIPFEVYGFTDASNWMQEFEAIGLDMSAFADADYYNRDNFHDQRQTNIKNNDFIIKNISFRLKQFFHSSMSAGEFNEAVKKMLMVAYVYRQSYSRRYYSNGSYCRIPAGMDLGGTPLNEAILVLRRVAEQFKKNNRIEVLNTIILTDGDASYSLNVHKTGVPEEENIKKRLDMRTNYVIEDKSTRHQVRVENSYRGNELTLSLLQMYKHLTGSQVIGFYLFTGSAKNNIYRYAVCTNDFSNDKFEKQYKEEYVKNKYFGLRSKGYDVFFMIAGDELDIEEVTMESTMKKSKTLLSAFKKMQTTKQISRVFLNSFIKQVA